MSGYKTIEDLDLEGKKVLVRLDLNVPLKEGKITDYTRIDASLPTINYIADKGGKVILMSHLGRPGGEKDPGLNLKPVAEKLSKKLSTNVLMAPDCIGEEVEKLVNGMKNGDIVLLENLRFHTGEEANDPEFVSSLAKLADAYINDAFGTAHRAHASTYGVPLELIAQGKEVGAGFLMDKELNIWKPIVESKGKGVAIIGGAKLKEKMKAVKKLAKNFDRIILGGVVANVFMKADKYEIGDSKYLEKDKDYIKDAKKILRHHNKKKIILPSEVVLADIDFKKKVKIDPKGGIAKGQLSADVIPTDEDIEAIKNAVKIVWFGPMGAYEFGFKEGSDLIVDAINKSSGYAVIGGGDLAAAAEGINAKISTGGGASIQYVTTGKLEALEALEEK